jgi:predicted GNAT family acetyltransferase
VIEPITWKHCVQRPFRWHCKETTPVTEVVDNQGQGQFELEVDGSIAIAAYRMDGDRIAFTHTEVPPALEGQGVGGALIKGALDLVRARGLGVIPLCSFVRHHIETHPDVQDLVA